MPCYFFSEERYDHGLCEFLHPPLHHHAPPPTQAPEGCVLILQCQHGHTLGRPDAGRSDCGQKRKCYSICQVMVTNIGGQGHLSRSRTLFFFGHCGCQFTWITSEYNSLILFRENIHQEISNNVIWRVNNWTFSNLFLSACDCTGIFQ